MCSIIIIIIQLPATSRISNFVSTWKILILWRYNYPVSDWVHSALDGPILKALCLNGTERAHLGTRAVGVVTWTLHILYEVVVVHIIVGAAQLGKWENAR